MHFFIHVFCLVWQKVAVYFSMRNFTMGASNKTTLNLDTPGVKVLVSHS